MSNKIVTALRVEEEKVVSAIHFAINWLLQTLQNRTAKMKAAAEKIEAEYQARVVSQEAELAAFEDRMQKRLNVLFEKHDVELAKVDAKADKKAATIDKAENILKAFAAEPVPAVTATETAAAQ
jgi:hypothetical protein